MSKSLNSAVLTTNRLKTIEIAKLEKKLFGSFSHFWLFLQVKNVIIKHFNERIKGKLHEKKLEGK